MKIYINLEKKYEEDRNSIEFHLFQMLQTILLKYRVDGEKHFSHEICLRNHKFLQVRSHITPKINGDNDEFITQMNLFENTHLNKIGEMVIS